MTTIIVFGYIAWVIRCMFLSPETDEGVLAGLFVGLYTGACWIAMGFAALLLITGIFA